MARIFGLWFLKLTDMFCKDFEQYRINLKQIFSDHWLSMNSWLAWIYEIYIISLSTGLLHQVLQVLILRLTVSLSTYQYRNVVKNELIAVFNQFSVWMLSVLILLKLTRCYKRSLLFGTRMLKLPYFHETFIVNQIRFIRKTIIKIRKVKTTKRFL